MQHVLDDWSFGEASLQGNVLTEVQCDLAYEYKCQPIGATYLMAVFMHDSGF